MGEREDNRKGSGKCKRTERRGAGANRNTRRASILKPSRKTKEGCGKDTEDERGKDEEAEEDKGGEGAGRAENRVKAQPDTITLSPDTVVASKTPPSLHDSCSRS